MTKRVECGMGPTKRRRGVFVVDNFFSLDTLSSLNFPVILVSKIGKLTHQGHPCYITLGLGEAQLEDHVGARAKPRPPKVKL